MPASSPRRPARAPPAALYVYAACVCASVLALQSLSAALPAPSFRPLEALLHRWTAESSTASSASALPDLRVSNLSAHRVRYAPSEGSEDADECPAASPRTYWTPKPPLESRVVVTWEDHPLAARSRLETHETDLLRATDDAEYELQVWVAGWGLDALYHPANRQLTTREPFAVLANLPPDAELRFRVRLRVTRAWAGGWLVASETQGPWTAAASLSPSRELALEAAAHFLATNKAFFALLSTCIGSALLVLGRLHLRRRADRRALRKRLQQQQQQLHRPERFDGEEQDEIRDLRQELADSESEVRRLMLYRGFGVDALTGAELAALERELRGTLKAVRRLQRDRQTAAVISSSGSESEDAPEPKAVATPSRTWRPQNVLASLPALHAIREEREVVVGAVAG